MSELVLTEAELAEVIEKLNHYPWYQGIYTGFKERVDRLIAENPEIPVEKSRVFYESCPDDDTRLKFDPYRPTEHICPKCGKKWTEKEFDQAWIRYFHEWLEKRVIESGIIYQVEQEEKYALLVRRVLLHYAEHYQEYPLGSNLLGPTRLFQSTYLESFWLTAMVTAYDLVKDSAQLAEEDHDKIKTLFYQSCEIIKSYNEGKSNRQAFNNTAIGAVAFLYNDQELIDYVLNGPAGFYFHMEESLLEDGLWYEGENYHFATLDHLLNLAEIARHKGVDLYQDLRPMFDGPLKVMFPDLTFPSRKDSWFGRGIIFHQEIYELGYARYHDKHYGGLLARAYQDEGGRDQLNWRAFLYCQAELPKLPERELRPEKSVDMSGTGMVILRGNQGKTYASLEYGHYGGGHGHPDRLSLSFYDQNYLWFLDPGTGWYHVPELGWYRSTLAHNTIVVDGKSQDMSEGYLTIFGEDDQFKITQAVVAEVYPGVRLKRTICLHHNYLFDLFEVDSTEEHTYDWVVHTRAEVNFTPEDSSITSSDIDKLGDRNGYHFLKNIKKWSTDKLNLNLKQGEAVLGLKQLGTGEIYTAENIGIPLRDEPATTIINRRKAAQTTFVTCYHRAGSSEDFELIEQDSGVYLIKLAGENHYFQINDKQKEITITVEKDSIIQEHKFKREKINQAQVNEQENKPPVSVSWGIVSLDDKPCLQVKIKTQQTQTDQIRGKVIVPWLIDKTNYNFNYQIDGGASKKIEIALPEKPVPEKKLNLEDDDYVKLAGRTDSAGRYFAGAIIETDSFKGISKANFPLYWMADSEIEATMLIIDKAKQVYWTEIPYQGESDCSARAKLYRDNNGLYLDCWVFDDIHVTDVNQDDLFENDSIQVYFDFRENHHQDHNYTPGVAAYTLAPTADKKSVIIEPIAGVREKSNRGVAVDWFRADGVECEVKTQADGYYLQAFFPYQSLGIEPLTKGSVFGFDLAISDNDGTWYRKYQLVWSGSRGRRCYLRGSNHNPREFGYVITL